MSKKVSKNKKQLMDKRSQDVAKEKKELQEYQALNYRYAMIGSSMKMI